PLPKASMQMNHSTPPVRVKLPRRRPGRQGRSRGKAGRGKATMLPERNAGRAGGADGCAHSDARTNLALDVRRRRSINPAQGRDAHPGLRKEPIEFRTAPRFHRRVYGTAQRFETGALRGLNPECAARLWAGLFNAFGVEWKEE